VTAVARYGKAVAHPGQGEALAGHLLAAAEGLSSDPGCLLYLVNREKADPDTVWVTEVWRSQADLDASLARIRGSDQVAAAMALVKDWQMIELEPLGGKGPG
jgi:quinol monooxygenase YgiN